MTFKELLITLGQNDKDFKNLGGRSTFRARAENGGIIITNSSNLKYQVSEDLYNKVKSRFEVLPENRREMTSEYTHPKWEDCPERFKAPYIPAIFIQLSNKIPFASPIELEVSDSLQSSAMTIYDSIIAAAKIRLGENLDEAFRPGELRELCGIPQGSFSPIFKGMRTDPGSAPIVHERARGLFIKLEGRLYKLSEKGKAVIGASISIPFASPLEIEASDLLQEVGYWSLIGESDDRQRIFREVVQRQGQPEFRLRLLSAYKSRCVISNCDAVPALEAAHISPYRGAQSNTTRNGLLLRADLHTLFDLNLIAIEPETLTVQLSKRILNTSYAIFHMTALALPIDLHESPDDTALKLRWLDFKISEGEN